MWKVIFVLASVVILSEECLIEGNKGCCLHDYSSYICTARDIVTWDIVDEMEIIVAIDSFSIHDLIGSTYTQTLPPSSLLEAELTFKNITHVISTLKIYGIQALKGYHVLCGGDRILISSGPISSKKFMYDAPTSVTLSLTSRNILISWNQTSLCQYTVQVSTVEGYQTLNTTINDSMITLNRNYSINQLEISSCSSNSTFIIEPCLLFDEVNQQILSRNYEVFLDGNWELNCINSNTMFNSTCDYENNTWNPNMCIVTALATGLSGEHPTATDLITTEEDPIMQTGTSFLMIILLSSLIPAGALTIFFIILMTLIGIGGYHKRKLSKSVNQQTVLDEESNYEQLQNHFNNARERSGGRKKTNGGSSANQEDNYSKLFHKKASLPPTVEYSTLQTGSGRKKEMDYAEITPYKSDSRVKQTKDIKVDYSKVESSFYEMYKELDLNRLLAILEPVSENFKLFGCLIGIPPLTVNEIAAKSASLSEGLKEVIFLWLDICRKDETLPNFHDLAEKINIMGHKELAEEISQTSLTGQKDVETEDTHTSAVKLLGPDFKSREMESKTQRQFLLSPQTQGDLSDEDEPPPIPPYHPCEEMENIAPIYEVL